MTIYYAFLIIFGILYIGMLGQQSRLSEGSVLRRKQKYCFLVVLGLTLIFGLRASTVGVDTRQYLFRYENYQYMMENITYKSEFGFNWFNYFLNVIGIPWQLYLVLTGLFISSCLVIFLKNYSTNLYFSVVLYVTIGTFSVTMSGLRQGLAISLSYIVMLITDRVDRGLYKRRCYLLAVFLWLVAISIHNSAVIFGLYFLIRKIRVSKPTIIFLIILSVASLVYGRYLLPLVSYLVPRRYARLSLADVYAINPLVILIAVVMPLYCLALIREEEDGKYSKEDSLFFFFSVLNILFTCLSVNSNQIGRLAYYFNIGNILLIPKATMMFKQNSRTIAFWVVTILCVISFHLGTSGGILQMDNYLFFWQPEYGLF